jgi:hypothetical protein
MGQDKQDSVYKIGDDDVEGHRMSLKGGAADDEDVEGHRMSLKGGAADDDMDPEGIRPRRP